MVRARTVALLLCAAAVATLAYADDEPYEARPDADAEPAEAAEPEPKIPEGPKFDYMDPDTWSRAVWTLFTWRTRSSLYSSRRSQPAQYVWMFVKLIAAFSPIWAILAVLMSAWEDEEAEKLKRSKKADFTFDSPE